MDTLKSLFSSAIRADVLSLLLNSPEERFYVREAAKLLRKNPSGVKRELDNLERMGIAASERVANLKYFQADKNSPLFAELKNLITKSLGLPGALKAQLRLADVKAAFIYGPYAEGEDVDSVSIFVVGGHGSLERELTATGKKFSLKIDFTGMDEEDFKLKRRKKDSGLNKILSEKRINLIGRV